GGHGPSGGGGGLAGEHAGGAGPAACGGERRADWWPDRPGAAAAPGRGLRRVRRAGFGRSLQLRGCRMAYEPRTNVIEPERNAYRKVLLEIVDRWYPQARAAVRAFAAGIAESAGSITV